MVNYVSVEEAVAVIQSGERIFGHGSACTPTLFYDELARQAPRLKKVELVSITQQGQLFHQVSVHFPTGAGGRQC